MVAQARRAFFRTVSRFGYSVGQIVPLSPGVFRRKQVSKHSFLSRRGLRGASNLNRSSNSPEQNPRGLGFYTWVSCRLKVSCNALLSRSVPA